MRRALLLVALSVGFAAPLASAATERPDLEARLPVPRPVFCADSSSEWDQIAPLGAVAYTWMEGPQIHEIYLSPRTCANLADHDARAFGDAAESLYHEWFHSNFGMRDEGAVECNALYVLPYVLRHYWGMTPAEAAVAYRRAFVAHTMLGLLAPEYAGGCVYPQPDLVP